MKYLLVGLMLLSSACATCVGHIGIDYNPENGVIWSVYPGTPAEAAGLRAYDVIVVKEELSGPAHTVFNLHIIREGQAMEIKVYRTCFPGLSEYL